MREFYFIMLYGLLMMTGFFLMVFWGSMAAKRCKSVLGCSVRTDRYLALCIIFTIEALGALLLFGGRAAANIHYGLTEHLYTPEAYSIGAGAFIFLLAMLLKVWLADKEYITHKWMWTMGGATVFWTLFAAYWAF